MKHLTILIPDGPSNLSSVIGAYMVFTKAEQYSQRMGNPPVFKVVMAGRSKEISLYSGMFTVRPELDISEITKTDLIVIPAIQPDTDFEVSVEENKWMTPWILDMYKKGTEIASLCTGAFLLASTGILQGRDCSTHWLVANKFRSMFPDINLVPDKLITNEQGIYTSGGAFSFLNFLMYLVEKYYGKRIAIFCSKVFEIDIDRDSQSPFMVFAGQKNHSDETVIKAQEFIETNFYDKINVEELANRFSVGRRNFDRRFHKATGNTPLEYLHRVKIEAAKNSFENTRKTIKEVMFDVGYTDLKAFRTVFKRFTGLSPVDYKNRYNKEVAIF